MTRRALPLAPLALLLSAAAAGAQVFPPRPVEAGWASATFALPDVEGTARIAWSLAPSTGGIVTLCGAWAADAPELAAAAALALSGATLAEGARPLMSGAGHFTRAASVDALEGTPAACAPTTATSAGAASFALAPPEGAVAPPAPVAAAEAEAEEAEAAPAPSAAEAADAAEAAADAD